MLREVEISKAPTPLKLKKLSDGGGLQLWLMPSGARLWRFSYRFEGKQRAKNLGAYTKAGSQVVDVGLKAARTLRDHYRGELAHGRDPDPKIPDLLPGEATFGAMAAEFREKQVRDGRAPATVIRNDHILAHVMPHLRDKAIGRIEPVELTNILRMLSNVGKHETAARARMVMSSIFRYAVCTGRADRDPSLYLKGAITRPKKTPRPAIVDRDAFGRLLAMIDGFEGLEPTKAALKLLPLLACRPGELRLAEWKEFDLKKQLWTIPAARTKMRREHKMHLPSDVVTILRGLHAITGNYGVLLFPALRGGWRRPMSDNTVNAALRTLGVPGTQHCAHGFRSSFSTIANESGKWRSDVIERHLAHEDANSVRRAYNRAELWNERVELAEWWVAECRDMAVLWG